MGNEPRVRRGYLRWSRVVRKSSHTAPHVLSGGHPTAQAERGPERLGAQRLAFTDHPDEGSDFTVRMPVRTERTTVNEVSKCSPPLQMPGPRSVNAARDDSEQVTGRKKQGRSGASDRPQGDTGLPQAGPGVVRARATQVPAHSCLVTV